MISPRDFFQSVKAADVVNALHDERRSARRTEAAFVVTNAESNGGIPHLTIRPVRGAITAEEFDALDGLPVRWNGMPLGATPKISVVSAEQGKIRLQGQFKGPYPEVGTEIQIIEMDYFKRVIELWDRPEMGELFLSQLARFVREEPIRSLGLDEHYLAKSLFPEQAKALALPNFNITYIWGTGGAGKTMTVSTLIRVYMAIYPQARILVCTTSNKGLDEIVLRTAEGRTITFRMKRYGPSFDKVKYMEYPDLLPDGDDELDGVPSREYPFDEDDVVPPGGVYAFTTNGALNRFDKLSAHTWDLLICDEASQIGLSTALPLLSLARSVVFVGDPEQCSPVAKTNNALWQSIVGTSAFEFIPPEGNRMVMLARQARMPCIVGDWSSKEFYNNKLQLAQELAKTPEWQAFRQRAFGRFGRDEHFAIVDIPSSAGTARNGRCIREHSAWRAVELIQEDHHHAFDWLDIAYITPFNEQANLFKQFMREARLQSVVSSTAHKLQGAEFPIVLLDPVCANGAFMRSPIGRQILNVGATRTQCKLIWLVSEEDLTNPWLTRLREFADRPDQLLG